MRLSVRHALPRGRAGCYCLPMVRKLSFSIGIALSIVGFFLAGSLAGTAANHLEGLLQQKRYLELERSIDEPLSLEESAFFRGIMTNRKNQVEESIRLLEPLAPKLAAQGPSWREQEVLRTLADDYSKTFEYAKSADTFSILLKRYGKTLSRQEYRTASDRRDEMRLLRSAPRQTVELNSSARLPVTRNALGLIEMPVEANGKAELWVLDTGANTSVVTESTATRIGLKLLDGSAKTGDINGTAVSFRVGVLAQLKIGNAVFHNVELPVASDQTLNIAGSQIQGIIGFPVQSALGRITIYADGQVGINTESAKQPASELFMEEQMPLAVVKAVGGEHLFSLDTGAGGSTFGVRFYKVVKPQLTEAMRAKSDLAGAGGTRHLRSYQMPDLALGLGGQEITLPAAAILAEPNGPVDMFFGNLGQDVFGAFKSYTIDFQNMTFTAQK